MTHTSDRMLLLSQHIVPVNQTPRKTSEIETFHCFIEFTSQTQTPTKSRTHSPFETEEQGEVFETESVSSSAPAGSAKRKKKQNLIRNSKTEANFN